jgi:nicotinamide-nucleotide amidase
VDIELVTIGDELLLGFTVDTNSAYIAKELAAIGVQVVRRTSVGDDAAQITDAITGALARTRAVITTGGLGPTSDDITKPAIAAIFDRRIDLHQDLLDALRERWKARGLPGELPDSNRSQAEIPDGADILTNRYGTAPGLLLEDSSKGWVAMLPGVPREMRGIMQEELIPRLKKRIGTGSSVLRSFTLRTNGLPESTLAEKIAGPAADLGDIRLAYLPGFDGVDLRLTVRAEDVQQADAKLHAAALKLRAPVERYVYGEGETNFSAVVLQECRDRQMKIAVAESCTGGLLAVRLTDVPGSSDVFVGGTVAYDNMVKVDELGVDRATIDKAGAVSEATAVAMARGARQKFRTEISVGITGIAGPGGGTAEKPVGLVWIAVEGPVPRVKSFVFGGDRAEIRHRATQAALSMIRRQFQTD